MKFTEFCMMSDLMEEFDIVLENYETLTEAQLGDLDIASVIQSGLSKIDNPVGDILGVLAMVGKHSGKKVKDIIKLFSKEGVSKIRDFIDNNVLGSEEVKYIMHKLDKNRYKGYEGLEQFVADMEDDSPKISDSLKIAVQRILK